MSETKKRRVHSAEFKAKVGLQALSGLQTINEIGQEHGVHPIQVRQWKAEIQQHAKTLFEGKRGPKVAPGVSEHESPELLFSQIGRLKVQMDWLKKVWDLPAMTRRSWIDPDEELPLQSSIIGAAFDARDGAGEHGTRPQHKPGASPAQGVSVPAARCAH